MDEKEFESKRGRFLKKIDPLDDPLERVIERKWNDVAQANGWMTRKMIDQNERSYPDRMYMRDGVMFMIEYKRKGKKQSDAQKLKAEEIKIKGGFPVYVIDALDKELAGLMFL